MPGMSAKWTTWHERAKAHKKAMASRPVDIEIAAELGVSRAAVNHWFNGKRTPTLREFFALCDVLGADPQEILFGEHSQENSVPQQPGHGAYHVSPTERDLIETLRRGKLTAHKQLKRKKHRRPSNMPLRRAA